MKMQLSTRKSQSRSRSTFEVLPAASPLTTEPKISSLFSPLSSARPPGSTPIPAPPPPQLATTTTPPATHFIGGAVPPAAAETDLLLPPLKQSWIKDHCWPVSLRYFRMALWQLVVHYL